MRPHVFVAVIVLLAFTISPRGQHRLVPVAALRGEPALELMLRKLDTVGSFMMTTAHPDDENNAMLAYFSHGKGYRTSLVTATRGEGGQNEIGPELFEALAVLRTEELLAAHRFDGAEQYFTRAVDFGYSFSIDETLEKWGKQEILGDYVRMIRAIRPDVIVGFVFEGAGGGQHHQTSSRLTAEAFRAAADPTAFPEQLQREGLTPWQAKKFYYTAGGFGGVEGAGSAGGQGKLLTFYGGDEYDPVLGRTYGEIGGEARSMHKCQGTSQLLPLPQGGFGPPGGAPNAAAAFGPPGGGRAYRLHDTVLAGGVSRPEREIFDGIDTAITSLAAFAAEQPPAELRNLLEGISAIVAGARKAFELGGSAAAVPALARGLSTVRQARTLLSSMPISPDGRYEIDHRLALKESQFGDALLIATNVRLEAVAGDGLVVPGQRVQVDLQAANRGKTPVQIAAAIGGFSSAAMALCEKPQPLPAADGRQTCRGSGTIPDNARLTAAHFRYATNAARFELDPDVPPGLPFRPTPFAATFSVSVHDVEVPVTVPIQFRSEGNLFSGEKRHELHVVPRYAVSVTPEIAVFPLTINGAARRDIRVTVTNHSTGAATAHVALQLPAGWRAMPAAAPVSFTREDEQMTVRFAVQPPTGIKAGRTTVKAIVRDGPTTFEQGYQVIEYPHTTRRHVLRAPVVTLNALDVRVKPNLTIGYIMGVGDEVADALQQLGARVEFLTADDLAWGELGKYDVIMTGVRAYERRADLRAHNQRLIAYAQSGGTVIVNYNKFEFNDAPYGPYPARVGRERVTDEHSEVRLLAPQHPVFTTPNAIGRADWLGWVQERGLYFLDTAGRDARYADLLEIDEPFPYNRGLKRGALVEAKVGRGRWIYIGLGLWRQLPSGTNGALRLIANLISLGTAPKPGSQTEPPRR